MAFEWSLFCENGGCDLCVDPGCQHHCHYDGKHRYGLVPERVDMDQFDRRFWPREPNVVMRALRLVRS